MSTVTPGPAGNAMTLCDLMEGDETRVLRILAAFCHATNNDLLQLDEAVRQGKGDIVRQVAYRSAMSCYLVGEGSAGSQLEAISRAGNSGTIDPVMTQLIVRARGALIDAIARVSQYMDAMGSTAPQQLCSPPAAGKARATTEPAPRPG